jgi:hypothetical protein
MKPLTTDTAGNLSAFLNLQFNAQFIVGEVGGNNTIVLDSQSQPYDTGYEHESSLRYLDFGCNLLNNGFDSCFLL